MPRIVVFGAGSIGCYVGGCLAASGADVTFIGRARIRDSLHSHGLHLSDYQGRDQHLGAEKIRFSTEADACADAALVLVTVKSAATAEAGATLAPILPAQSVVISLQNGLGNAASLAAALPAQRVIAGMVPFNVVNQGQGHFHQGSEGELEVAADPALQPWLPVFAAAGLPLTQHADMLAVLWAKLLLNLNNAINTLCGLPLKQELSQRDFRRCVALAQAEALELMRADGIQPARLTPLPAHWIPRLLDSPDVLFRLLANKMLEIDPQARSSMWEDLEAGRQTEIEWINGEVLRLAARLGRQAPVNARLIELIRTAETGGRRDWSGAELLAELRQAAAG